MADDGGEIQVPGGGIPTLLSGSVSPAIQVMLDDKLFERVKLVAKYMAHAEGYTPKHLLGKTEACFAVVTRSITWKLDPFAVCLSTYQTPGGGIGYEGKLCQAIMENSGKIEGGVKYKHYGDWAKIQGKFKKVKSQKEGKRDSVYPVPDWKEEEEAGVGVTVIAKVIGEVDPRTLDFDLIQAFPRNSTLWATDPKTQICYTAVRRFGSVAAPGLFMGVPFDREDLTVTPWDAAKDITPPKPQKSEYKDADGDPMDPEKSTREHYIDKAQAKREAEEEAALDKGFAGATGKPDPDVEEEVDPETGEVTEKTSEVEEAAEETRERNEDLGPKEGGNDQAAEPITHPYEDTIRTGFAACVSAENIKAYWEQETSAEYYKHVPDNVKRNLENAYQMRLKELGG